MFLQKSFKYADLLLNKYFIIIISVENSCAASYFVETNYLFKNIMG